MRKTREGKQLAQDCTAGEGWSWDPNLGRWAPKLLSLVLYLLPLAAWPLGVMGIIQVSWGQDVLAEDWIARFYILPAGRHGRLADPTFFFIIAVAASEWPTLIRTGSPGPWLRHCLGVGSVQSSGQWNAINWGRKRVGGRAAGDKMWRVGESEEGPALWVGEASLGAGRAETRGPAGEELPDFTSELPDLGRKGPPLEAAGSPFREPRVTWYLV